MSPTVQASCFTLRRNSYKWYREKVQERVFGIVKRPVSFMIEAVMIHDSSDLFNLLQSYPNVKLIHLRSYHSGVTTVWSLIEYTSYFLNFDKKRQREVLGLHADLPVNWYVNVFLLQKKKVWPSQLPNWAICDLRIKLKY